jgi:23S rRNA (uridine2552-2'-O)-methyltransferase
MKMQRDKKTGLTQRVKTARKKTKSQVKWLQRQLNDPFVAKARKEGFRGRAVYKLQELDDKYKVLHKAKCIVDLGCAPGSWMQLAGQRSKAKLIGIDLQDMKLVEGARFILGDVRDEEVLAQFTDLKVDLVLSDMAANATGDRETDHVRIVYLCEIALDFALKTLVEDGTFICKILQGGGTNELVQVLKNNFKKVAFEKPKASRSDSSECYLVATGRKFVTE